MRVKIVSTEGRNDGIEWHQFVTVEILDRGKEEGKPHSVGEVLDIKIKGGD